MFSIPKPVLVLGDGLALLAFTLLGLLSHEEGVTLPGVARTAGPILAGWFAATLAFRTYTKPGLRTLLPAWAVGVTGGVVLRSVILHHGFGHTFFQFLSVALAMSLLLLLAWRGIALLIARATRGQRAATARS